MRSATIILALIASAIAAAEDHFPSPEEQARTFVPYESARIGEVPALWFERKHGTSRFRVLKWLPAYLRWYRYAFATTWLRRPAATVALRSEPLHTA